MHFITWHGTVVCLSLENGELSHASLLLRRSALVPLDIDNIAAGGRMAIQHPTIGQIELNYMGREGCHRLVHGGKYVYADPSGTTIVFDRAAPENFELFLGVNGRQLKDLQFILGHRWVDCATRKIIMKSDISMSSQFRLRIGARSIDLRGGVGDLVLSRTSDGSPVRLRGGNSPKTFDVVLAQPGGSILLNTASKVTQSRRASEILTVAAHRQVLSVEPTQEAFERDAALLHGIGGVLGIEDLFESLNSESQKTSRIGDTRATAWREDSPGMPYLACPVIPLGSGVLAARALEKLDAGRAPMPFDKLTADPAMIRDLLDFDLAVLADRLYCEIHIGLRSRAEPEVSSDPILYQREAAVSTRLDDNEPSQRADYADTVGRVDRLRKLLDAGGPKVFFQYGHLNTFGPQDFIATAAVVETITSNAIYLQLEVAEPDPTLMIPLLSVTACRGRHQLLRLQPTSEMGAESFASETDNSYLRWLIGAYSNRVLALESHLEMNRAVVRSAFYYFDQNLPAPAEAQIDCSNPSVIEWANSVLARFCMRTGLHTNFEVGSFNIEGGTYELHRDISIFEIADRHVLILFPSGKPLSRGTLNRALTPVYLVDAMLRGEPLPDARFLIDLGDHASFDCVSFCTNLNEGCVLPDSDFISSAGYSDTRIMVDQDIPEWSARLPIVFWRGATTGRRTKAPPEDDTVDDFSWLPRLDMCRRLAESKLSEHCNVGVTSIVQIDEPRVRDRILASGLCKASETRSVFLRHKFTIVIDGNSNAWSSLFCALLMASCVLLVKSKENFRQWYFGSLTPWTHYVPVSDDLDDLEEQVSWVLSHDQEAEAIGRAARKLAGTMTFEAEVSGAAIRLRDWLAKSSATMPGMGEITQCRAENAAGWILGHVRDLGDSAARIGTWVGTPGSGKWLEGFQVVLDPKFRGTGFTYRAVLEGRKLSDPATSGVYVGTRGRDCPIYGIVVNVEDSARTYEVEYEVSFVDGTRIGPVGPGVTCFAESFAAMEALRLNVYDPSST